MDFALPFVLGRGTVEWNPVLSLPMNVFYSIPVTSLCYDDWMDGFFR